MRFCRVLGLIATGAVLVTNGGDAYSAQIASNIAASAHDNNYLKHTESAAFASALQNCGDDPHCISKINKEYSDLSLKNTAAMLRCGTDQACLQPHIDEMNKVSGDKSLGNTRLSLTQQEKIDQSLVNQERNDRKDTGFLFNTDKLLLQDFASFEAEQCGGLSAASCLAKYGKNAPTDALLTGIGAGHRDVTSIDLT